MDKRSNYFYISGFISLFMFVITLGSVMFMMINKHDISSYALKKDNFISISLDLVHIPNIKTFKKKNTLVPISANDEISENIDVNDLFSDVWTKKIVHKKEIKKAKNSRNIMKIQQQIKTKKENDVKSISENTTDVDETKSDKDEKASSTAQEVNEYNARIQALIYKYFHVPPNSEGNSIKCVIELNALGKMIDFRILSYSTNVALNDEADKIKNRLISVIFPISPQNISTRTVVILISKE